MRRLLLLAALAGPACAEEFAGFRIEVQNADAVFRFNVAGVREDKGVQEVTAAVARVFKGDGLASGDQVKLTFRAEDYEKRLDGDLADPAGVSYGGLPFFSKLPAAGPTCVGLAKKSGGAWVLTACCLCEPSGGISFQNAEQAKAYGEERRRAVERADALMERYAQAAGAPAEDAAIDLALALLDNFTPGGNGDAALAVGVLLDDVKRLGSFLQAGDDRFRKAAADALQNWLAGRTDDLVEAHALQPWLISQLTVEERQKLMPRLLAEFRQARKELDDWMKKKPDPKHPESESEAAKRQAAPGKVGGARALVALCLDPAGKFDDLGADELVEQAESFANQGK